MLLQVQSLTPHFSPSIILPPFRLVSQPSLFLPRTQLKPNPFPRFAVQAPKCSVSVVSSDPTHLELTKNDKPFPAEVSRTIMELSSVATLSTITQENWPLGIGVRFAVDSEGTPLLCFNNNSISSFVSNTRSTLHVQLEQCGLRTPQCTVMGNLEKVEDKKASKKLCSLWKKNFEEEVDEDLLYVVSVERVLHMEDFGEDGVWVTSADYKSANPDPLRDFAEKIVDEINANNIEDVYRFCNIYADLGFQV